MKKNRKKSGISSRNAPLGQNPILLLSTNGNMQKVEPLGTWNWQSRFLSLVGLVKTTCFLLAFQTIFLFVPILGICFLEQLLVWNTSNWPEVGCQISNVCFPIVISSIPTKLNNMNKLHDQIIVFGTVTKNKGVTLPSWLMEHWWNKKLTSSKLKTYYNQHEHHMMYIQILGVKTMHLVHRFPRIRLLQFHSHELNKLFIAFSFVIGS